MHRFSRSSHCYREAGFSLIEVLAALVVLATLLTGLLVAKNRSVRQAAAADLRLHAVTATDALLDDWWRNGGLPTLNGTGGFPSDPDLHWSAFTIKADDNALLLLDKVDFSVTGDASDQTLVRLQWWVPHVAKPLAGS